MAASAPG